MRVPAQLRDQLEGHAADLTIWPHSINVPHEQMFWQGSPVKRLVEVPLDQGSRVGHADSMLACARRARVRLCCQESDIGSRAPGSGRKLAARPSAQLQGRRS
jgi:hypothetical protein